MTPTRSGANLASPATPRTEPAAQVLEALQVIDTSLLDKLLQLRVEQTRLETYRNKAAELKDGVKGVVWNRVVGDYAARSLLLQEQAAPLKVEAQREYLKLRGLQDRITAAYEEAQLVKEELEFREAVGELSKDDLKAKADGPERRLDDCRRDLEAIEAQKAKFVEAFGSEADLEAPLVPATGSGPETAPRPAASPEPPAPAPASTELTLAPVPVSDLVVPSPQIAASPPPEHAPASAPSMDPVPDPVPDAASPDMKAVPATGHSGPEDPADSAPIDATRIVARKTSRPAPEPAPSKPLEDRTLLLPRAMLLVSLASGQTQQSLGPINYVGRTEDNQIQINTQNVSRRHALIKITPAGFAIKDLGSQNGTFLNGERVSEKVLADGDRIVVGDAQIVFRLQ
jgi:FHA domain